MSKKIIACIDGSASSAAVCDAAAWASNYIDSPITLLHVLDREGYVSEANLSGAIGLGSRENLLEELVELDAQRSKLALQQGKVMLEAASQRIAAVSDIETESRQRHGDLVETLEELDESMDLLVIGREGAEVERHPDSHIGSHLEHVIRTQHHPILVAVPDFNVPKKVLIAFDGSDTAKKALQLLCTTNLLKEVECHLVMVAEDTLSNNAALKDEFTDLESRGVNVTAELCPGDVESVLVDYVKTHDIDLLIMGAYGHSRIRQFFVGSTTTKLMGSSPVSMLLLR
ncbi:universal stress protein [Thaumasiovibrio subtropicus]|uniref:universal stress protein n=1 Tax=Thaumasiovibrio subtropicus TaxID=1891207 RepID=UPI000B354FF4|nr:universal stress protein [Thaumasiovibrio subtropicus]